MRAGQNRRLSNWMVGLIAVALIAIGTWYAFVKEMPWADKWEVQAVFPTAQNVRIDSPVRIAGVNVGAVTKVEHLSPAAQQLAASESEDGEDVADGGATDPAATLVTMEITEAGRPLKTDSSFRLLPRLFLEGNLLVDLQPGSPSAPEVDEDHVFPLEQTSNSVQLNQVLTTLQSDVREQLQIFLEEFGAALVDHGGAEGFQELYRTSPGANRFTAEVNDAFLGQRPHDLSGVISNLGRVVRGLGRHEQDLRELVTNFRRFAGAFAAEDEALEQAIAELPPLFEQSRPTFAALNRAFPPLRAFSREALPGTRTAPAALDAATPLLRQVRLLMSERELRGLTRDLGPAVEELAAVAAGSPETFGLVRSFASCFNEAIIPWQNMTVPAQGHPATGRVYQEAAYALTGIAGESRSGDANGQYIRTQGGGGAQTVIAPNPEGQEDLVGTIPFPILNSEPSINDSVKSRFRPNDPCERQEPPDLRTKLGGAPEQQSASSTALPGGLRKLVGEAESLVGDLGEAQGAVEKKSTPRSKRAERKVTKNWREFLEDYERNAKDALSAGGSR